MKAKLNGKVLMKEVNTYGNGDEAKDYHSFLLFVGGQENASVSCSKDVFDKIKEGQDMEIFVDVSARVSYGEAKLKTKLIEK